MSLNNDDVTKLSAKFDEQTLGVKVQSLSRSKDKAMLVCYLQHTDVASRLDSVDPAWSAIITDERMVGETATVRMRITLKGVLRENIGEGSDPKSAVSDALKRTAMLFGVGRYLYDSETVWVPYNEAQDKYRQFTIEDYKRALRPVPAATPQASLPKPVPAAPVPMSRMEIGSAITKAAKEINLGTEAVSEWALERYSKPISRLSLTEMEDFLAALQSEIGRKGA